MAKLEKRGCKYRGRVQVAAGDWKWVTLYTDKRASEKRLADLQAAADQRASGVTCADTERLALGIDELARQYVEHLRAGGRDPQHVRISQWMLAKLVELGGWKFFRDITNDSLVKIMAILESQGRTASYRNKFIVRAKAFVHWLLPVAWPDPLRMLRRVSERGAKRTRARRACDEEELGKLFGLAMPEDRRLAYALAAFNGFRRSNVVELMSDELHLGGPIPFVELRRKQGQDDAPNSIPLHPYVVKLLARRLLMPGVKVVSFAPDMKTMAKDLLRAGIASEVRVPSATSVAVGRSKGEKRHIEIGDHRGRRLDFHALRHTFQTNLDRSGCSRASKKRLMRHANQDVTDGYAHAELEEMRAALVKLVVPDQIHLLAATGTGGNVGTLMGHEPLITGHFGARGGTAGVLSGVGKPGGSRSASGGDGTVWHDRAPLDLIAAATADIVQNTRPSTQVD